MKAYNEKIFRDGQSGLTDAWNFQQPVFRLSDYDTSGDAVGYLSIEAMDLELPLYLGASDENLDKGAAVLGQTSMPIGGTNSNCVIAAHRGWKGIPMFRDIELLQPGDKVILTNLWETLEYQVVKCIVITPDDIDAVKIMAGEDMLTLITCHPYTYNFQRYVVYCSRNGQISAEELPREGVTYVSSQKEIEREQKWNFAGLTVLGGGCMLGICRFILGKRKKKNS